MLEQRRKIGANFCLDATVSSAAAAADHLRSREMRCSPARRIHRWSRQRADRTLRIDLPSAATVLFTSDGWESSVALRTVENALGLHVVELNTAAPLPGEVVTFTWHLHADDAWAGRNYEARVGG